MIVIVGGNKGGSGKSTLAINIAVALAMAGSDICFVDADNQRSGSHWFSKRERNKHNPLFTLTERKKNISRTLVGLDGKFDHVIVDVPGRNSEELLTGAIVADVIIAPHQCSELDLATLSTLDEQVKRIHKVNPDLKVFVYHAMATTNVFAKNGERQKFLKAVKPFESLRTTKSVGYFRTIYRNVIDQGLSVLESRNDLAINEIQQLIREVF